MEALWRHVRRQHSRRPQGRQELPAALPVVAWRRPALRVTLALMVALALVMTLVPSLVRPVSAEGGLGDMGDVPSTTPSSLGDLDLTSLQYGDPSEEVDLVAPPEADASGGASLGYDLPVPPGRAGVAPDLSLAYTSGDDNGWVGVGWDLSVGAISVDTTFGAPRYLGSQESETYQLDGDRLFPNAIRTDLALRVGSKKSDFVRTTDTEHEQIVRHGSTPSTYCWQVRDKEGNERWYGGEPGPNGTCVRRADAVLTAPATGVSGGVDGDYFWGLTYVNDISGNTVRYAYDRTVGVPVGQAPVGQVAGARIGVSLYLQKITYSGFRFDAAMDKPAYEVTFLRDRAADTPRRDVKVDASAGQPVVTAELLRRVEVKYLAPAGAARLVKGWDLAYTEGPFEKSLLTSVGRFGADGVEVARHTFSWWDDVRSPDGSYDGFAKMEQWGVGASDGANIAATSALGTAFRGGADGGAYIGFNPLIASKIGSFGGSFNIAGGQTKEVSSLLDLNADGLPDKVSVAGDGKVSWRQNLRRPGGSARAGSWFAPADELASLDSLGQTSDIKVTALFEAYPVVAIQVGGGFGFSLGDRYFADANGDGRVDFIAPGAAGGHTVFYNVAGPEGRPTFIDSSLAQQLATTLEVPLDQFTSSLAQVVPASIEKLLTSNSPRIDTVRRWVAPFSGRVAVRAPVALTSGAGYTGDGARVSIERGGATVWSRTLTKAAPSADPGTLVLEKVSAGEAVYLRLDVVDGAAGDEVEWSPVMSYVDDGGTVLDWPLDAQGRSQAVYSVAQDFTLFGRPLARTSVPNRTGAPFQATMTVTVTPLAGLTDDLTILGFRGRTGTSDAALQTFGPVTVPQRSTTPVTATFPVTIQPEAAAVGPDGKPRTQDDVQLQDWVSVSVTSDSPVDVTDVFVSATVTDPTAPPEPTQAEKDQLKAAGVVIPRDLPVAPGVQVFARSSSTTAYTPVVPDNSGRATFTATVDAARLGGDDAFSGPAVLVVKSADAAGAVGVLAREPFPVRQPAAIGRLTGSASVTFDAKKGAKYWLEVDSPNPAVGAAVAGGLTSSLRVTYPVTEDGVTKDRTDSSTGVAQVNWPDVDGVFPSGYRGWGLAGYNADADGASPSAAMVLSHFDLTRTPDGGNYDSTTKPPDASGAPSVGSVVDGTSSTKAVPKALPYIPWGPSGAGVADRWRSGGKATLYGNATRMQADRLGADKPAPGVAVPGREAPQTLGVQGSFTFMIGLVASFTAAAGGGRELRDFTDYNGDGLPDIRNGSQVEYTGPRGSKAATVDAASNTFGTQLALGGGLAGTAISTGKSTSASKSVPNSTKSSRGMNIGAGFAINTQWDNPVDEAQAKITDTQPGSGKRNIQGAATGSLEATGASTSARGTILDRTLLDINGDGLPDRVDSYTSGELWVSLNLGYRFAPQQVQWTTGRSSSSRSVSGTLSVGFQLNAMEFAGGIAYTEGVEEGLFGWVDLDGDGVPDRLNGVDAKDPTAVFGSADGMQRPKEIDYGSWPTGNVAVDADRWQDTAPDGDLPGADLPGGQFDVSRTTSLSGGFDFSFYIGPLCLPAPVCYIVVNPGAHGGYDRMTGQIGLEDMDGDGSPDAVYSSDSEDIQVRLNKRGRTNLLKSVTNPLGGSIALDYERTGNTPANPESLWVMKSVAVDDGHPGDGADVQRSLFTYDGAVHDPLLRDGMGFASVREDQVDEAGRLLRRYERTYLNSTPYDSGLLTSERLLDPAGTLVSESTWNWQLADGDPRSGSYGETVSGLPAVRTPARTALFDRALWPRMTTETTTHFDSAGVAQGLQTVYTYSPLGDVTSVLERNEVETTYDDVYTVLTYPACGPRTGARALGPDDSWVSVPQSVTLYGGSDATGPLLRQRDGGPDLCANAVPTRIAELASSAEQDPCGKELWAITEMGFDDRGSYDTVAYPDNTTPDCADYPARTVADDDYDQITGCDDVAPATGRPTRYCVDYTFDPFRFTDIAEVTDNHGVTASATYDPLTGRIAGRVDENGNPTTWTYDAAGRLATITAPREQGTGSPTVTYTYGGLRTTANPAGAPFAWATAAHHDVVHPTDPLTTVAFVDGIDRTVQRKRDSVVEGVPGQSRTVEGAIDFDALGREVAQWYPVVETAAAATLTTYNPRNSSGDPAQTNVPRTDPTRWTYDLLDRRLVTTLPDASRETTTYSHAVVADPGGAYGPGPVTLLKQTDTDPLGQATSTWADVGGAVYRNELAPAAANDPDGAAGPLAAMPSPGLVASRIATSKGTPAPIAHRFEYSYLGQLLAVVDPAGARTEHTYDLLGHLTSTDTPDGGLVAKTYAPAGNLTSLTRAAGSVASYRYDLDRLVEVGYSDGTPKVSYTYGDKGAAGNGAGRVLTVTDGAMERSYRYDAGGNVVQQRATRAVDPFGKGWTDPTASWTTGWDYDSLGRVLTTSYPSGERLSTSYDLGGRPDRLTSTTPQPDLYDQYGKAVPRPDDVISYVDQVRYDEFGQGTFVATGTGVLTRYGFEPARRFLTGISTSSTATTQHDGSVSTARPLQRLQYAYDKAGNVRDAVNRLYGAGSETSIDQLPVPTENGVPGASQQSYTYDGFYRITGAAGKFVDRTTNRDFSYASDYAANGNLLSKQQTTTTTLTTGTTKPKNSGGGRPGTTSGGSSTLSSCTANTSSGGGAMNDDSRATYAIAAGDLTYRTDGDGHTIHQMQRLGARSYTYDDNGNLTDWREPCSNSKDISRQLTWDAENRVTRIAEGNNDTDLRYSAEGVRSLERGPGGLTWFVNDQWRTVNDGHQYATIYLGGQAFATHRTSPQPASVQPVACTDTAETTCACPPGGACVVADASECTAGQLFDPTTSTCQPRTDRTLYFVHKDLQGSLRVVTDGVGGVFQYADYLPTGRPWVLGQSTIKDTPYLFAGGWTDPTYDMISFGQRWFENREQQFYSTEPLLEDDPMAVVDDPRLTSAYTYAASNPLRYVDPSGRVTTPAQSTTAVGATQVAASGGTAASAGPVVAGPAKPKMGITFGGRAGYEEAKDGKMSQAKDKVDKYTTILSVQTEDGVRTIRVFGQKVSVKDTNAPAPSTGASGGASTQAQGGAAGQAASDAAQSNAPTKQNAAPDSPSAQTTGQQGSAQASANAQAGTADQQAGGGAQPQPPSTGGSADGSPSSGGSASGGAAESPGQAATVHQDP